MKHRIPKVPLDWKQLEWDGPGLFQMVTVDRYGILTKAGENLAKQMLAELRQVRKTIESQ